jgi:hypothetical protein
MEKMEERYFMKKNIQRILFLSLFTAFLLGQIHCSSFDVIPEPTLNQTTVKSSTVCLTWNWHPFCMEGKPNSLVVRGILNNGSSEKKFYLEYYLDSFDTDLPVGVSLKVDGVYYNLRKAATDYADTLKITSEVSEDALSKLKATKNPISLSYSNRKNTLNFDLSSGDSQKLIDNLNDVVTKLNSLQKLKIVK